MNLPGFSKNSEFAAHHADRRGIKTFFSWKFSACGVSFHSAFRNAGGLSRPSKCLRARFSSLIFSAPFLTALFQKFVLSK